MTVEGKITELFATQEIKESFRKREFVIEYAENPQYPEFIKFEMIQANCDLLDDFTVGDSLTVHFNLKGRKWTDPQGQVKYFNSLQAWRLEKSGNQAPAQSNDGPPPPTEEWMSGNDNSSDDDLPF